MTAEELLMMSDEIETYSADDALIVDAENKIILTPAGGLLLGVESDEEAERIKFKCPRIVGDNIDLSTLQLRVNYKNANGNKDSKICTDVTIDGNYVRFSWLLTRKVTKYKGTVEFIICAVRTATDGSIKNEWNTTLAEGKVLEGLEVDIPEEEFEEPKDIVLQLLGMLDEKEAELLEEVENLRTDVKADIETTKQKAMDDVEAKGVETLKTIPEDYIYIANLAKENKQLKANAIKRTYSGETIVATDSSQAKFEGLRVLGRSEQVSTTGKNLLDNVAKSQTINGVTFTVNDDKSVTVKGTATENASLFLVSDTNRKNIKSGTYLVSGSDGNATKYKIVVGITGVGEYSQAGADTEIVVDSDNTYYAKILVYSGASVDTTIYPMIRLASIENGTYEPYTGGKASPSVEYQQPIESVGDDGEINVGVYGGNLLPYPYYANYPQSANGATIDVQEDGGVVCSGTPTGYIGKTLYSGNVLLNGVITGCLLGTYANVIFDISVYDSDNNVLVTSSSYTHGFVTIDISEYPNAKQIKFIIKRKDDNKPMSGIAYPIIVAGDVVPTVYEKYKDVQNLQISTPNGLPAVEVTDASLATYTDADGVMWCADEVVCGEKKIQRVYTKVFDGSENISIITAAENQLFAISLSGKDANKDDASIITQSTHFIGSKRTWSNMENKRVQAFSNTLRFRYDEYATVEEFKTFLAKQYTNGTPVIVKYILAEPIETDLSTSEIEAYKALTSNYPTTTILNDENAHMEAVLVTDTKNHIEQNYVPKSEFLSVVDRVSALEQKALA